MGSRDCGEEEHDDAKPDFKVEATPFCVVGQAAGFRRTWCKDIDEAIAHAGKLLGGKPGQELYVMQAVKIVRIPVTTQVIDLPPITPK